MRADKLRPDDDEDQERAPAAPKRIRGSCETRGMGKAQTFERKTLHVSRLAEFASGTELIRQTGHSVEHGTRSSARSSRRIARERSQ